VTEPEPSQELSIHRADTSERGYMVGLARQCFGRFGDYGLIVGRWLDLSTVVAVVACEGPSRVGFAIVAPHRWFRPFRPRFAELVAIAIDPERRARGFGRCLLERVELVARSWGAPEVRLHTACENDAAQRFFTRAGYRPLQGVPSYYPNGQEAIEMVHALR
jgi:ribosomal protein S18 acetylase RimI-like enzyme